MTNGLGRSMSMAALGYGGGAISKDPADVAGILENDAARRHG